MKAFTLIEMLLVMAVLGVVAAALLIGINPFDQLQKSSDAQRKSDLAQVQRALELYYQDNGSYPTSSGDYKLYNGTTTIPWGSSWQPYMNTLPKDPSFSRSYVYYAPISGNGQSYYLYASLERGSKDAQVCNKGNACVSLTQGVVGFPSTTACGGTCNYGISSPNVSP